MSSLVPRVALKQLKEDQVSINKSAETFVIAHLRSHRLSQFSPSHTPHTPLTHLSPPTAQSDCTTCLPAHFCEKASTAPQECPAGTYTEINDTGK